MTINGLEAVFLENRDKLLRFLRARGAGEFAEDLLQDLWLRAATAEIGPIAEPLSYLFRVANNLMLDRHRAATRAQRRDHDWYEVAEGTASGTSSEPSAERALVARERLGIVEAALASLGERPAAVFRRYRLEGASQREIASEFGISLSSVEKDLQKAYRALIDLRRNDDADS